MRRVFPTPDKEGYILISVLAVIALLSGFVAALLLLGRASSDTAQLASRDLRRDALLQSGVALAGYQLFVLKRPGESVDGQQLRLDTGVVTLRISSDAGKVDLNGSGKDLLAAAYRASGLTGLRPDVFATRVMDWRATDAASKIGGTEASDAQLRGSLRRDGAFRSLDDLRFVAGIGIRDIDRLRPYLTIFNPAGRLQAFLASEELIAALPGIGRDTVKEVLRLRSGNAASAAAAIANLLLVQAALIDTTPPRTYRVGIETNVDSAGSRDGVSVVLSAGATPGSAYQVLSWREGLSPE